MKAKARPVVPDDFTLMPNEASFLERVVHDKPMLPGLPYSNVSPAEARAAQRLLHFAFIRDDRWYVCATDKGRALLETHRKGTP